MLIAHSKSPVETQGEGRPHANDKSWEETSGIRGPRKKYLVMLVIILKQQSVRFLAA